MGSPARVDGRLVVFAEKLLTAPEDAFVVLPRLLRHEAVVQAQRIDAAAGSREPGGRDLRRMEERRTHGVSR